MCKFNPKNNSRRIDPCLKELIRNLNIMLPKNMCTISSCCGHGKYPMTIIVLVKDRKNGKFYLIDLMSKTKFNDRTIIRKKNRRKTWEIRLYRKDKHGYYYIPEVQEYYKINKKGGQNGRKRNS